MLISLLLIALITAGGASLTYLVTRDAPLMWRLAAGSIIGSAIFGIVGFTLSCLLGFGVVILSVSLAVTLLPAALLGRRDIGRAFRHDWAKATGKLQGANLTKIWRFAYYAFFFVVLWFFFERAMFELKDGIYTGGSQNLGDLPFHLGAILGFSDGNNFPPQNPSFAGARFSYPFIADFLTACFVKLGADVKNAMVLQDVVWGFSLLVILERFVVRLTGSRLAGRLAPPLLFLSGGLGFLWFFKDYWASGRGFFDLLSHLPRDYTISEYFRWGNSLVVLFITQRSLLLGMPLTVLVLGYLWKVFSSEKNDLSEKMEKGKSEKVKENAHGFFTFSLFHFSPFLVGLLAGTLPLIHLHSLVVLFVVTAFLFVIRPARWREWTTFAVGVALIAVPELLWSISGSASETSKFFGWHFGWDAGDTNIFWFWIKNTGFVIPVLFAGLYLVMSSRTTADVRNSKIKDQRSKIEDQRSKIEDQRSNTKDLLLFYSPFIFLFLVSNVAKLAPWEWDNIKILIYWFVGSIPLMAIAIVWAWQRNRIWKTAAVAVFITLIFAGSLDVWRTASGQNKIKVFDADAVALAEIIKRQTSPGALFLNAPTYNTPVVLTGRRSLMRYSGHLSSHGIDYSQREDDVKRMYQGGGVADMLLRKYEIEYVLVSPEERNSLQANEDAFKKYPVIAESGQYRVYKIK